MNIKIGWLLVLVLSGCSVAKEQFDCQYNAGIGCKSITEVNNMVTAGLLGSKQEDVDAAPQKVGEQHLRVWLAPYQERGYCYEGQNSYSILTN